VMFRKIMPVAKYTHGFWVISCDDS